MKAVHILLLLVVAALALGCVDKSGPDSGAPVSPAPVSSQTPTPAKTISESDDFGLDEDLTQIDSLINESGMDISLSEINADAFI